MAVAQVRGINITLPVTLINGLYRVAQRVQGGYRIQEIVRVACRELVVECDRQYKLLKRKRPRLPVKAAHVICIFQGLHILRSYGVELADDIVVGRPGMFITAGDTDTLNRLGWQIDPLTNRWTFRIFSRREEFARAAKQLIGTQAKDPYERVQSKRKATQR